jgi:hypothetical protein
MQFMHLPMSTFAVGKVRYPSYLGSGSKGLHQKEVEMRIVEIAAAGLMALAAQFLVVGTIMI